MLIETLGCAPDTRFLGYFGLLIDRKRPLGFVEAVAAVVRRHPDLPVMGLLFGVAGRESPDLDKAVLARAAELGIGDRIRLMGFRSPVEPWMMATDILLVPAVREPFGRTLIEAMFLETPVVATRHGGNPEAIEDGVTGFLVEPENPEAFVAPIRRLLTEPGLREAIAGEARRRALQSYGIETHVNRVTAIYESVAGERKTSTSTRRVADRRAVQ
jgi:glycosyltransferase involved in cell wall biosynthesis